MSTTARVTGIGIVLALIALTCAVVLAIEMLSFRQDVHSVVHELKAERDSMAVYRAEGRVAIKRILAADSLRKER